MDDITIEVKNFIINTKKAYYEYLKEQELSATEHEKNIAQIKTFCSALKARREVTETFTKLFFDERKMLRDMADNVLNKAIEKGDVILAQLTLELIEFEYDKDLFGKLNQII